MKKFIILAIVLAVAIYYGVTLYEKNTTPDVLDITLGLMDGNHNEADTANTYVIKKVLEDQGYNVTIKKIETMPMYYNIGAGKVDAIVTSWLPVSHFQDYKAVSKYIKRLNKNFEGTTYGLVVPDYVTISSIEELNSSKDKFNGKMLVDASNPELSQKLAKSKKSYNLEYEYIQMSSSEEMGKALQKAIDNKEWVVFTGSTPGWMFAKWNLKYLDDPKRAFAEKESQDIYTVTRKGLEEVSPRATKILERYKWDPPSDLEKVMLYIHDGMKPEEAAAKWVSENQDKVDIWLGMKKKK
ncbi:MAG: glycine betaine ABC transporter substrate-binding protein [Bacillota bacterium]